MSVRFKDSETGRTFNWPNCIVADCPNMACLRLVSDKCWPHTVGAPLKNALTDIQRENYENEYLRRRRSEKAE